MNGKEIIIVDKNEKCIAYGYSYKDESCVWSIYEEDIKNVVTKEQMEKIMYKVK